MNGKYSHMIGLLLANLGISSASGAQCTCPKNQHVFANMTVSGIQNVEMKQGMIESFDIVKNKTCSFTWKPEFRDDRVLAPLVVDKLISSNPCFAENNVNVDVYVKMEECCQPSSIHIATGMRFHSSTAKKLDIIIDFDKIQPFELIETVPLREASSVTDGSSPITRCLTTDRYLDTYDLNDPHEGGYQYYAQFDDRVANGIELWVSPECVGRIFFHPLNRLKNGDWMAQLPIETLWSYVIDSNPRCAPPSKKDRMEAFIVPFRGNKDANEIYFCNRPLPYKYYFGYDTFMMKPSIYNNLFWEPEPKEYSVECFSQYYTPSGNRVKYMHPVPEHHDVCRHMDNTCAKCTGPYHFNPDQERCVPDVQLLAASRSVEFSFAGPIVDNEKWDLYYELSLLDDKKKPQKIKRGQFDQFEFKKAVLIEDLKPGNYVLEYGGQNRTSKHLTVPDVVYFQSS